MKKFITILLTIIALILFGGGSYVGLKLYNKYSEGTTRADLTDYYDLKSPELGAVMLDGVILDDTKTERAVLEDGKVAKAILDVNCRVLNGICYLDLYTVQQYLHNRFYYSEIDREIRYTDATTVVAASLDGSDWTSTTAGVTDSFEEPYTIAFSMAAQVEAINEDGTSEMKQAEVCYIAIDFIEKYVPVTHEIFSEPNRVVIESMELCKEVATVNKDTAVRWRAGVKSDILAEVPKGKQVMILNTQDVEGWVKVATDDGCIGYIKESRVGTRQMVTGVSTLEYTEPEYTSIALDEKIRLGFHAVYNQTANGNLDSVLETAYNINVISPTWFSLSDNAGNFTHIASHEYVQIAHDRGIQVWGLVEDITNKKTIDTYEILGNHVSRTHLIEGLVEAALAYDLDGLNIDFEGIRRRDGVHFVQFLRELSIRCREEELILSVDNYPPSGRLYYDYDEQGVIVDYVVLMGYDEHWGGSGDPGSTSSQPFLENSLDNLLSMVPADKVINALPFYTRLWTTSGDTVTDKAIFMKSIDNVVSDYRMIIDFDEATGQKYARAEVNGVIYEMWIEDYASMENKLIAVQGRDLAGVAAWRLGYEEQAVWELIGTYIQ